MPKISVEITPRIAELLQSGVISITLDCFSSGKDVYGRVVVPHPRLGIYPHQSMTLDELEQSLEKVKVGRELTMSPHGEGESSPKTTPVKKGQAVSVICRNDPDIGKVPTEIAIAGVRNLLPKASLSWKDLAHLSDDQLNRRILAIGKEIGNDKAVSRISAGQNFQSDQPYSTLYKWWNGSSEQDRFTLITSNKAVGKAPINKSERSLLLSRLGAGQYPFRGSDAPLEEEEDEDEEEEARDLERRFNEGLRLKFDSDSE